MWKLFKKILVVVFVLVGIAIMFVFATNRFSNRYNFQDGKSVLIISGTGVVVSGSRNPCEITEPSVAQQILDKVKMWRYFPLPLYTLKCITIDVKHSIEGNVVLNTKTICDSSAYKDTCQNTSAK